MLKAFVGLCSLLLLSSCASTAKMYAGDPRPSSEVASIVSWTKSRWSPPGALVVHPLVIDGQPTNARRNDGTKTKYYVLPGERRIKIVLFWNVGFDLVKIVDPVEMVFNAKAGHSYLTKASATRDMSEGDVLVSFWIEDAETHEVVSGTRPNNSNGYGGISGGGLPSGVSGTAVDSQLQEDVTRRLIVEASKYFKECKHQVLKVELYDPSQSSVIAREIGGDALRLEMSLRDEKMIHVEKWFVESCEVVNAYEVLLMKSETGTDIMVKKLKSVKE